MPIEIKELHIKINVNENSTSVAKPPSSTNKEKDAVTECVEQVMKIMERKKER